MGNIMKMLSQNLSLTKTYTNHCIWSTVISNMIDNNGHDVSDVAAVTGYKSNDALRKNASHKRESQIQSFSETLTRLCINTQLTGDPKMKLNIKTLKNRNCHILSQRPRSQQFQSNSKRMSQSIKSKYLQFSETKAISTLETFITLLSRIT